MIFFIVFRCFNLRGYAISLLHTLLLQLITNK